MKPAAAGHAMKIYLAAPVFSQAERIYNRRLATLLEDRLPSCQVVLPQDFRVARGESYNDRKRLASLFKRCRDGLMSADLIVAVLDGADADSGVAFEVGFARGQRKPVIGLRTDYRELQIKGLNMMLAEGCTEIVCRFSFNESMEDLADVLVQKIEHHLPAFRTPPGTRARRHVTPDESGEPET